MSHATAERRYRETQDVLNATRAELNATINASDTAARMAAETIAAQQAHARELEGEVARLKAETVRLVQEHALLALRIAPLIVASGAALDYFTDKADLNLTGHGNREASLASELAEAIRKAKGER